MAESVIDIVTRLSYQTNAVALQKDIDQFQKITDNVNNLQRTLNRLKSDQQQTSNILDQRQITQGIQRTTQALNQENAAMQRLLQTSGPLQDALQREAGIIGRLSGQLNELRRARVSATSEQDIARYNTQITATQTRLNELMGVGVNGRGRSVTSQLSQGVLAGLGIGTGYGLVTRGVSATLGAINEASQLAAAVEGVQDAFNRLNDPNLLNKLRDATKGTLSDLQLMQKAVEFNNFGLPIQKLGELLDFARIRARETGQSIEYVTNSLVSGIARQSPRILDNLGLSQVKIREEFKRIGDFAQAAFNVINNEAEKANQTLLTTQDRLDQINAKVKNSEAVFGQFINYVKLLGIDVARIFTSNDTVDTFESYAESYRQAQKQINEETANAPYVAGQAQALFFANFKEYTDKYKSADFDSRRVIEKQADDMYAELIKSAQKWQADGKKLDDTYFAGLKQAFQQTQAYFKANRITIDNVSGGDIRKLSGEDINELQAQIKRRTDILSREDKKDEDAFKKLNQLSKQLSDEEAIRSGKSDIKAEKAAETLAQRRLKLEADLQKKIADLREDNNKSLLEGEEKTISTIVNQISGEYIKAIDLLDIQYNEAKRKGLITDKSQGQFDTVRGLITSDFENKVNAANLKENIAVQKRAAELRQSALQDEIRISEERQKNREKTEILDFSEAVANEQKKSLLEVIEANKRYEAQRLLAKGNTDQLTLIAKNQQDEIKLIEEKGLQAQLDVYTRFLDDINQKTNEAYAIVLNTIDSDANRGIGALQDKFLSGSISYQQYLKRSGRINDNANINTAAGNVARVNDEIANAKNIRESLQLQSLAGIDVKKQLDDNQKTLDSLNNELAKFKEQLTQGAGEVQNKRQEEFQKQLGFLDSIVSATAQAYNQINAIQQQSLDREINIRQDRVQQAERLADRGNTEALRREQEYLKQAQNQREQAARRQIAVNAALTSSEAILSVVSAASQGDPYTLAARVIAAVIAVTAGIYSVSSASRNATSNIASFKDGVIDLQGPGTGTSDSIPARLSKGESVMTAKETQQFHGTLTAIRNGYNPIAALASDLGLSVSHNNNVSRKEFAAYGKKLDILTEAVIDNKVGVTANINENGIYVATERVSRKTKRRWAS